MKVYKKITNTKITSIQESKWLFQFKNDQNLQYKALYKLLARDPRATTNKKNLYTQFSEIRGKYQTSFGNIQQTENVPALVIY